MIGIVHKIAACALIRRRTRTVTLNLHLYWIIHLHHLLVLVVDLLIAVLVLGAQLTGQCLLALRTDAQALTVQHVLSTDQL